MDLTHFQFENGSRATRCRFLQSFAVPDEAVQFQQSWGTLRRVTWFDLSPPSCPSSTNMYMCMCMCMCMCAYVYVYESVRVCARVYVYDLPQWFHDFCYMLHIYKYKNIYMLSSIVKDTTTFEIEMCGYKQATAHAHGGRHDVCN